MNGLTVAPHLNTTTINELRDRISLLRNHMNDMRSRLLEVCNSLEIEEYIDPAILSSSAESLNSFSVMQRDFFEHLTMLFPESAEKNLAEVDGLLDNAEVETEAKKFLDVLAKFKQIDIDNPDIQPLLLECKNRAAELERLVNHAELQSHVCPYSIFMKVVYQPGIELTQNEEETVEKEFPRPIPRLLYQGKFYMVPLNDQPISEPVKYIPDEAIAQELINEEVSSRYTFNTAREGTDFHVKEILRYLRQPDIVDKIKLLSMLNNCQIVSADQLVKWGVHEANLLEYLINPLIKDGYVTQIREIESQVTYFCLSEKGRLIFTKKDVVEEITKRNWLLCKQTFLRPFKEKEELIYKTFLLNETALHIINYGERPKSSDYFHCQTPVCQIPYLTFSTPKNEYIVFSGDGNRELEVAEEINSILINSRFDILIYLPIEGTDEDAWNLLDSLSFDSRNCYIARFINREISYFDRQGQSYTYIVADTEPVSPTDDPVVEPCDPIQQIGAAGNKEVRPEPSPTPDGNDKEPEETGGTSQGFQSSVPDESMNSSVLSSTNLAKALLDKYSKADFSYKKDFRDADFAPLLTRLLSENRIMEATVLAKTLSLINDKSESGRFYNRLLYAVNSSLDTHRYTGLTLSNLDADEASSDLFDTSMLNLLRLSCFAWALLIPDEQHDFTVRNYKNSLLEQIDNLGEQTPQLGDIYAEIKQIFIALFDLKEISPAGFSPKVLTNFISEENRKKHQSDLVKRAEELLTEPQIRQRINGVPELLSFCFGKNSDLNKCMLIINQSKFEQRPFVERILESLNENLGTGMEEEELNSYSYSERKIQDLIDKHWKNVGSKVQTLKYSPRNTVEFGFKKRLEAMGEWLDITNDNSQKLPDQLFARLNKTRNQLLTRLSSVDVHVDDLSDSLEIPIHAGLWVAKQTFSRMKHYLENGVSPHEKWEYIGLLSSYQINLNKEHKPNIIAKLQEIKGFEPWRRMLGHIIYPKMEPLHALSLIDNQNEPNWYNNYESAEQLNQYLYETTGRPMDDLTQTLFSTQKIAENIEEVFKSEFELKYAYGCIEEGTKESIFHIAAVLSDHFKETGDLAHYRALLSTLEENSKKETEEIEHALDSRMKEIIRNQGLTYENAPILRHIERNIHDQNLAVAEEYINRLDRGELSIPDEETEVDKETDYHDAFLKRYDRLYRVCQKHKGDVLRNWGFSSIEAELSREWTSRLVQNSQRFINSWPKRKDDPGNALAVVNLLKYIGLDAIRSERDSIGEKYNHYKVHVASTKKHLRDYPHPIANYGTLMGSYLHVVCLFGSNSANELINIMTNKLQLGGNTVVLMDGALSLADRRKVAEQFKSQTSGQNSFLLIDRLLMLYLATLDEGERLVAMLKCTLPYTFYQPFSRDGGPIADEMFYGRKAELNDILLPTGANLVYGGRQLGKTALLERAKSIAHQPADRKYALYISLLEEGREGLVRRLNQELIGMKLIDNACQSLDETCRSLERGFSRGKIVQLQLFIDETDEFLKEASRDNYIGLRPLLNLMRSTKNRFKFVLAGLHNVARSRHALDNNGILPQLGAPLCIKPLSPADAKKLVERPLSYLGFQMGKQQLALILANTNYYPGIIHFFCYTLIQAVSDKYKLYYSVAEGNPPYFLKDEQLKSIFASEDLNKSIKDKLHMTLRLDTRYKIIADVFAFMSYEDERNEVTRLQGYYDKETIMKNITETVDGAYLEDLNESTLESLLYEMSDMGILSTKPNSGLFRFRKNSFLGIIGTEDEVWSALLGGNEGTLI